MDLYILRHAEAGLEAPSDFARTLTELGKLQLSQVVGRHTDALARISQVWVSPYVRTQQTLAHIRHWLPASLAIETSEALTPESPVRGLLPLLERSAGQCVLMVSHQPLVGEAVAKLCGLEPGAYRLGTSALTHIKLPIVGFGQGSVRFCDQP